jgi:phosphoribosylglycinamide formyltransferase-1
VARVAVAASGQGSNFEAVVMALRAREAAMAAGAPAAGPRRGPVHECVLLVHDRADAFAALRASRLGVPARHLSYAGRPRAEAEAELGATLKEAGVDLLVLAGFMRLLSPAFVRAWRGRILNVHPALLPAWPGVDSIRRSFEAGERRFGASVHLVDEGMDTGPVIAQEGFEAGEGDTLEAIEARVHEIEHRLFPAAVLGLLDRMGDREVGA